MMAETYCVYIQESVRRGYYLVSIPDLMQDYIEIKGSDDVFETIDSVLSLGLETEDFNVIFGGDPEILKRLLI
jgi:predicted RNase H-like HicB family nuclease